MKAVVLDFAHCIVRFIELQDDEDAEEQLYEIGDKEGFNLNNCQWMTGDHITIEGRL